MFDLSTADLVPMLLAVLLGGAVGLDREAHGRPAGLRTHILVCLSATLLIQVSLRVEQGVIDLGEAGRVVLDPNRMGAGIVTGIGFLGAATVLRVGDLVRGVTTAACIWFVAGLGIVLGQGEYALAVLATLVVLVVLRLLTRVTRRLPSVAYRRVTVHAHTERAAPLAARIRGLLAESGLRILDVSGSHDTGEGTTRIVLHVAMRSPEMGPDVVDMLSGLEGVTRASWSDLK